MAPGQRGSRNCVVFAGGGAGYSGPEIGRDWRKPLVFSSIYSPVLGGGVVFAGGGSRSRFKIVLARGVDQAGRL